MHYVPVVGNVNIQQCLWAKTGIEDNETSLNLTQTGGIQMKKWVLSIFFSILLTFPAVSALAQDTSGPSLSLPTFHTPSGSGARRTELTIKEEEDTKAREKKQKELNDKKVDDAIKKAWGEK